MKAPVPHLKTAMTPFPHSIALSASLADAAAVMQQHRFHHLPVTSEGKLVGMLTDPKQTTDSGAQVRDYYDPQAYIVSVDEPLADVLMVMVERRLDAVVVTRHGKLAGVFTTIDACRALAAVIRAMNPQPENDNVA